jgi:class 3 adenylate cyclase
MRFVVGAGVLIALVALTPPAPARAAPAALIARPPHRLLFLDAVADHRDDPGGALDIAAVASPSQAGAFEPAGTSAFSDAAPRWYRFRLGPQFRSTRWVLRVEPGSEDATVYAPGRGGVRVAQFGARSGAAWTDLEPADVGPVLYVRVRGDSGTLPGGAYLETAAAAIAANESAAIRGALYGGIFFTLCVTACLFFLMTRRGFYAAYAAYTLAMIGFLVIPSPLYLNTPLAPWLGDRIPVAIAGGAAVLFSGIATRLLFETRRRMPGIDRALLIAAINGFPACFVSDRFTSTPGQLYFYLSLLAYVVIAILAAVQRIRQGYRPAVLYACGFASLFLGFVISALQVVGLLPLNTITQEAPYWGIIGEAFAFLAALAYSVALANRERIAEVERYNVAVTRFVPQEFLEQLERTDVTQVQLGDHVERGMTVLFSDIRSYTTISETMSPAESFAFINAYFGRMAPIVRTHGGFIDKYVGDAIMALFPGSPADALAAAIALQRAIEIFNAEERANARPPIRIGVGLHRGELMLGTVGEAQRMETTVIADAVNIASRVEGLTKAFDAAIVASESVIEGLGEGSPFRIRSLGLVQVQGARRALGVYEVYDGDAAESIARKTRLRETYAAAITAYAAGDFATAATLFDAIRTEGHDGPASYYFERSVRLGASALNEWDGIERFASK